MITSRWKQSDYFSHIQIPDTWDNLTEFADWFMQQRMPMMIPIDSHVYVTDNATAIVVFRHGHYQAEMYIGHPSSHVEDHFHPGMDIITMMIGNMDAHMAEWGAYTDTLHDGTSHDAVFESNRGTVFMTFEYWQDKKRMSSASVNWKGVTAGPTHSALIKKHYPTAIVEGNYAEVLSTDQLSADVIGAPKINRPF